MTFENHYFRQEKFSLREKRLLGRKMQSPELVRKAAQVVSELQKQAPSEMSVATAVESVDETQRAVFIDQVRTNLQSLTPELQKVASENLERLIKASTTHNLDALKSVVESMKEEGKEEEKPGFMNTVSEKWNSLPETARTTIAYGSGAVAAVAVGVALYKFGKWFLGSAKKTKEKAQSMLETFTKFVLGSAVVTAIAGAGWYGSKQLGKLFGIKKAAEKTVAEIEKRIAKTKETIDKMEEAARLRGEEMTLRQKEQIVQLRKSYEDQVEELRKKREEEKNDETTDEPKVENGSEEEVVSDGKSEEEPEVIQDKQDASLATVAYGLTRLLKNREIPNAIDALKDKRLGDVIASTDQESIKKLLDVESENVGLIEAAEILVKFCSARQNLLKVAYNKMRKPTDPKFEDMKFGEFVEMVGSSYALVQDVVSSTQRNGGDLTKWKGNEAVLQYIETSPYAQKPVKDLMEEVFTKVKARLSPEDLKKYEEQLDALTFADIVKYASKEGLRAQLTVDYFRGKALEDGDLVGMIIQEIVGKDGALPEGKFLAPFFHEVLPNGKSWSRDMKENHKAIEESYGEMNVSEAMRLYFYKRMIDSEDVAQQVNGIAMTQYEVLRYIQKKDKGRFFGIFKSDFKAASLGLGEDLINGSFIEALRESGIPEEVAEEAVDLLKNYGPDALKYGALIGAGPMKFAIETWMGAFHRWPVVTAAATYLFPPVRFAVNAPIKTGKWALFRTDPKNAVNALNHTKSYNPFRSAYSAFWEKHAGALSRWKGGAQLESLSTGTLKLGDAAGDAHYNDLKHWLRGGAKPEALEAVFVKPLTTRVVGVQKRIAEINSIVGPKSAADVAELAKLQDQEQQMQKLINSARHLAKADDMDDARKALMVYARPLRERLGAGMKGLTAWKTAGWVAGIGMQGAVLWADWEEWGAIRDQQEEVQKNAQQSLIDIKKRFDNDSRFESKGVAVYVHKTSGVEVNLRQAQVDLGKIDDVYDQRAFAQGMRTATSAGVLGSMALMGPRLCMGPAGLVIVGIEVVIRTGVNAKEQSDMRAFLMDCPPWLLAYLGSQALTGKKEYDWLRGTSSWMISDFWPDGIDNATDKMEIQKRMLFTMFYQDLAIYAPEVAAEVMAGMESPEQLNEFFKTDFQTKILPTFHALLLRQGEGNESWKSLAGGGAIDSGWMIVPPNFTRVQISKALRESAVLYTQDLREERYLYYARMLEEQKKDPGTYVDLDLKDLVASMGAVKVFGKALSSVPLEEYDKNKSQTRASLVMQALTTRLNTTKGDTRSEKQTKNPNLYTIPQSVAAGLSGDIDLSSMSAIASLLDNPALSYQLQQVLATTLDEESAVEKKRWNDWQTHFDNLLVLPGSAVEAVDSVHYASPFWVADNVADHLKEPRVSPEPTLFGALTGTRSGDGISRDGARKYITTGMERVFEHPEAKRSFHRNHALEDNLYSSRARPAVYTRGVYNDGKTYKLSRYLRYPEGMMSSEELKPSDLKAVFFEGIKEVGGSEYLVMATYVFGDPKTGKISIAKQAAGSAYGTASNGAKMPDIALGTVEWSTASSFLEKPGAEKMLEQSIEGQKENEKRAAEEKAKWDAIEKKYEDELHSEQVVEISKQDLAREAARKSPKVWIEYPSQSTRLDKDDDRPSYEYIAYLPEREGFIYLQLPAIYRGASSVRSNESHVVAKRGDETRSRITYERENEKPGGEFDRRGYIVEKSKITDSKKLEDHEQLNAVATEIGLFSGTASEEAQQNSEYLTALYRSGADILTEEHRAEISIEDGRELFILSGSNKLQGVECAFFGGKWNWRDIGEVKWDNRPYILDAKKVKNSKLLADRKELTTMARRLGIIGKGELELSSASLSQQDIGHAILVYKYGCKLIEKDGETFYQMKAKNGRRTVDYVCRDDKWYWRNASGTQWMRLTLDGSYRKYIAEHRSTMLGDEFVYKEGLALPIQGNERASIQKILATYVDSMEDNRTVEIEDHILSWYKVLKESDRRKFLSRLDREIYNVTRGTKTDRKGYLYLDSVTYRTSDFGKSLSRYDYSNTVMPAIKKYMQSIGYTFS